MPKLVAAGPGSSPRQSPVFVRSRGHGMASAVATALAAVTLAGCNAPGALGASSSCATFNKSSVQAQQAIVLSLYHKAHPQEPKQGPGAVNAIFNVSYECSQEPASRLADLGDFKG
jgi:hypothetical protein